jgi:phosphogluconate dehydratase
LAKLRDGDIVRLDAQAGTLSTSAKDFAERGAISVDLSANKNGIGRELFEVFRRNVGTSETGAGVVV